MVFYDYLPHTLMMLPLSEVGGVTGLALPVEGVKGEVGVAWCLMGVVMAAWVVLRWLGNITKSASLLEYGREFIVPLVTLP